MKNALDPDSNQNTNAAFPSNRRGILFADVSDSSRLLRELGDVEGRAAIVAALAVARRAVEAGGGVVIDEIGDELFCQFSCGDAAARASLAIQETVLAAREKQRLHAAVRFRIGFCEGPVGVDEERIFGDTVYLARRVATIAKADQVLTTADTLNGLAPDLSMRARWLGAVRPKGRTENVQVLDLSWAFDETLEPEDRFAPEEVFTGALHLTLPSAVSSVVVNADRPSIALGRNADCDIVVPDDRVSRHHARVDLDRSEFRWVDFSRNGSFLRPSNSEERIVVRTSVRLTGSGEIRLGPDKDAPLLHYFVRSAQEVDPK